MFDFAVHATDPHSSARTGTLTTPHGTVETPVFMPVGTAGSIKGLTPQQVRDTGTRMVLGNTYHLRPGPDVVADLDGLHRFMQWDGPILTDSGGYQVFSLAELRDIGDDGVTFRSHVDGSIVRLDPAIAMDIQRQLGADIIMAFDECPPIPCERKQVEYAVDRTVRWAKQCRDVHRAQEDARGERYAQWLFGIVQGGLHLDLRLQCTQQLCEIGFDGYAIGGLSVGESHAEMIDVLGDLTPALPADQPRYLMGVGMPCDILAAVETGIDLFDCVLPTRNARNAYAFTRTGPVRLRNSTHTRSDAPIEPGCDCYACTNFSLGYLRHLFMAGEMLGPILATMHNLRFYQVFLSRIRELIREGKTSTIRSEYPVAAVATTPEETAP